MSALIASECVNGWSSDFVVMLNCIMLLTCVVDLC